MKRGLLGLAVLAVFGFAGGVTAGLMGGSAVQASGPKVIDCQAIRFLDESGQTLAAFGIIDGKAKLVMTDKHSKTGVTFGIEKPGGAVLRFHDSQGNASLHIGIVKSEPIIMFEDEQDRPRLALLVGRELGPKAVLFNENKGEVWSAP